MSVEHPENGWSPESIGDTHIIIKSESDQKPGMPPNLPSESQERLDRLRGLGGEGMAGDTPHEV